MKCKITSLQLKNYDIINNLFCNQFSNINLIIGENRTGKTFLLKLSIWQFAL